MGLSRGSTTGAEAAGGAEGGRGEEGRPVARSEQREGGRREERAAGRRWPEHEELVACAAREKVIKRRENEKKNLEEKIRIIWIFHLLDNMKRLFCQMFFKTVSV
jgi:hypothetical protein